ncbi:MAG: nucleotidyltransferase substrate binding protein [Spirochaetota bacterium]|jgi:nucleotidyltransferase substrate binding protein (TIGR01987 family)|nr:nucleotidyltransferase substrate binding protein [Spirochaetota bacterium]HPY53554.1 nucleotidyltransferase substrate binding protein [Treponemataceae bacterium]HQC27220.1 nucleotidyltransferase substrate binding protein [Treponemataceae bacterium]HUH44300.1 nucleotidyltransferase substrate binding protein [Treponemataceae bacterium]
MENDIRWQQRFQNFHRAYSLLSEILYSTDAILALEPIVKEGIIQRFEYTFELAWKTLKDKMEFDGLQFTQISPKLIFKQAFQAQYIDKVDVWLQMTDDRNLMSHTYDHAVFDTVLLRLKNEYLPELEKLYDYFLEEKFQ